MKAVILARGLGTRLRPFTEAIPKPLLPLGEKALLEIQIERLRQHGLNEVFLATNYKSEYAESFFGDGLRSNAIGNWALFCPICTNYVSQGRDAGTRFMLCCNDATNRGVGILQSVNLVAGCVYSLRGRGRHVTAVRLGR